MKSKQLDDRKTFVLIFQTGDDVAAGLAEFVKSHKVGAASLTGVEGRSARLFQLGRKTYKKIPLRAQVEVLSLVGDVAVGEDGQPIVHAHVVVGRSDGTAHGGHLLEGHLRPTLELILVQSPAHLQKRHDPESGLAHIRL